MRLLIIGGSGHVGGLVLPHLAAQHEVCVYDRKPPTVDVPYIQGDVADFTALSSAMLGRDALIFMAMGPAENWEDPAVPGLHFDVSPKGLYLALRAARDAGVRHAVYTSSMSVYAPPLSRPEAAVEQRAAGRIQVVLAHIRAGVVLLLITRAAGGAG